MESSIAEYYYIFLIMSLSLCISIYIYREREREREISPGWGEAHHLLPCVDHSAMGKMATGTVGAFHSLEQLALSLFLGLWSTMGPMGL